MRIGHLVHPTRHPLTAIVFVVALVAAFFALAPSAYACHSDIVIHKVATGAAPDVVFTVEMNGTTTDGAPFFRTVDVVANGSAMIDRVPPGTYGFVEIDAPPGATIVPDEVTITHDDDGVTFDIVVTNPAAKLAIEKVETGDTAPGGTYTFDITGPVEAFSVDVTAGDTWTSDWLPLGAYTVTEQGAPAGTTILPNPAILDDDGETLAVTATNPFRDFHGKLAIHKVETGDTASGGTYTFDITGPVEAFSVDVTAGDTWTSDWLPLGAYTVTEQGAPAGTTILPNPAILDDDGETVTVTATNPYRDFHGKLAIEKVETGNTGLPNTYTIDVAGPTSFSIDLQAGDTWTSDWLPLGTYTVTERDAPTGATIAPNPVTLVVDGATVNVVVTNPVLLGSSGTLPATGGGFGIIPWIAAALLATGTGLLIVQRGSRHHA